MQHRPLADFISDTGTTPRIYFSTRFPYRSEIVERLESNVMTMMSAASSYSSTEPLIVSEFENTDKDKDVAHIIRCGKSKKALIVDYVPTYLMNSLILNIMLADEKGMGERLNHTVFAWYYYLFMKNNYSKIEDLTHNVCYQLEEMIKVIIQKELSTYRNYNTSNIVQALRTRLASERLVNMGNSTSKGINFRR